MRPEEAPTHWVCPDCGFAAPLAEENRDGPWYCDDSGVMRREPRPDAVEMVLRQLSPDEAAFVERVGRL